jgi:hypothetical protein
MSLVALHEGIKSKTAETLFSMASGVNRFYTFKPGYYTYLELITNPTPVLDKPLEYSLYKLPSDITKHMWIYSNLGGLVGVITAHGSTIREAKRRVHRTIQNIKCPSILYKPKLGTLASEGFSKLKAWNYF